MALVVARSFLGTEGVSRTAAGAPSVPAYALSPQPFEPFGEASKIESRLPGFLHREGAFFLRRNDIGPAIKCAEPPAHGVLDRVAALEFEHFPRRELTLRDGASLGHIR
jgi:hypothetical protein